MSWSIARATSTLRRQRHHSSGDGAGVIRAAAEEAPGVEMTGGAIAVVVLAVRAAERAITAQPDAVKK